MNNRIEDFYLGKLIRVEDYGDIFQLFFEYTICDKIKERDIYVNKSILIDELKIHHFYKCDMDDGRIVDITLTDYKDLGEESMNVTG